MSKVALLKELISLLTAVFIDVFLYFYSKHRENMGWWYQQAKTNFCDFLSQKSKVADIDTDKVVSNAWKDAKKNLQDVREEQDETWGPLPEKPHFTLNEVEEFLKFTST